MAIAQSEAEAFKIKTLKNPSLSSPELKPTLSKYDFSKLFTQTDNSAVYGFIGDNYQRIRIKFITVTKATDAGTYNVYGKSLVKGNICDFKGTLVISNIKKVKITATGLDDESKNKGIKGQFEVIGNYRFLENKEQNHSGIFEGAFVTDFYMDKNDKIKYDDIDSYADGFLNNPFVGTWTSYSEKITKRCNWGDYRIPNSGDLDIGAGEFSPAPKYIKNGWQASPNANHYKINFSKAKTAKSENWWE